MESIFPAEGPENAGAVSASGLRGQTQRSRWAESIPTFCFYQDLRVSCRRPLEHLTSLSLWPMCFLLCPPHPHFPAQEARAEQGRGPSVPHHYRQHRPGSGVPSSPGAQGPGWAMPLLTSQEHLGHHSAGRGQHHWQVSPGGLDLDISLLTSQLHWAGSVRAAGLNINNVEIIRRSQINMGLNPVAWDLAFLTSSR